MTTTISAPIGSSTSFNITVPTGGTSLTAFWNGNGGANINLAVSLPTTATGRNLTALGRFSGRSTWRILNGTDQSLVNSANLTGYKSSFSNQYYLPIGTNTFVASTFLGTHILTIGTRKWTKAEGTSPAVSPIVDSISSDNYVLRGAGGNDTLTGGTGDDTLTGFSGADSLTGGAGADKFVFNNPNEGIDTIADFTLADNDVINVSATGFGGLNVGTLDPSLFASTEDGTAKFIYSGGILSFDTDTANAGGLVQIATLTGAPGIGNTNIVVI